MVFLCVILHLAILVQCQFVTDRQTDRQTHDDSSTSMVLFIKCKMHPRISASPHPRIRPSVRHNQVLYRNG